MTGLRAVLAASAVAALAVLVACTSGSPAQPDGPSAATSRGVAAMDSYLTGLMSAGQFSGTVLVARGGRVLLDAGYGMADRASVVPDSPQTIFQIGSVTKQFTAIAVAILAQQGKLRLTGRACAYLARCPPSWRDITIAELLSHTSGIANWSAWHLTGPLPGESADPIAAVVAQAQRVPLAFAPGTRASYSNPGYVVLGDIIRRVSGMSYPAFLRTRIFDPLGMTRTGVYTGQPLPPGNALGYLASGQRAPTRYTLWSSAAGAMYSTAGDLYKWDQALFTGKPPIVMAALLRQVLTVHAPCPYRTCPLPADLGYGYGWFIGGAGAGRLVHHSGSTDGFWAYNGFYPATGTVVVILSNLDTVAIDPISARLNQLAAERG